METRTITRPIKVIRAYCLDCCGTSSNEAKLCPSESCPLYPFRFGKNPYRTPRTLSEEHKAKLLQGLSQRKGKLHKGVE